MDKNIVILGLNYEYNTNVGKLLSDNLGMFFLDFKEYVEYSLFSTKDILEKCGKEYLMEQEKKCVKSASEFENTVICMPYSYFFDENANKLYENAQKVYVYFSKNKLKNNTNDTTPVDVIAFDDRDEQLKNECDIKVTVGNKKIDTVCNEIKMKLEE